MLTPLIRAYCVAIGISEPIEIVRELEYPNTRAFAFRLHTGALCVHWSIGFDGAPHSIVKYAGIAAKKVSEKEFKYVSYEERFDGTWEVLLHNDTLLKGEESK